LFVFLEYFYFIGWGKKGFLDWGGGGGLFLTFGYFLGFGF
jgi:hypothetical protein